MEITTLNELMQAIGTAQQITFGLVQEKMDAVAQRIDAASRDDAQSCREFIEWYDEMGRPGNYDQMKGAYLKGVYDGSNRRAK